MPMPRMMRQTPSQMSAPEGEMPPVVEQTVSEWLAERVVSLGRCVPVGSQMVPMVAKMISMSSLPSETMLAFRPLPQ